MWTVRMKFIFYSLGGGKIQAARKIIQAQKEKPVDLFGGYGLPWKDVLQLNRTLQKSKL